MNNAQNNKGLISAKSPKQKSPKPKSPKKQSPKKQSPKKQSPKPKSPKQKSPKPGVLFMYFNKKTMKQMTDSEDVDYYINIYHNTIEKVDELLGVYHTHTSWDDPEVIVIELPELSRNAPTILKNNSYINRYFDKIVFRRHL